MTNKLIIDFAFHRHDMQRIIFSFNYPSAAITPGSSWDELYSAFWANAVRRSPSGGQGRHAEPDASPANGQIMADRRRRTGDKNRFLDAHHHGAALGGSAREDTHLPGGQGGGAGAGPHSPQPYRE